MTIRRKLNWLAFLLPLYFADGGSSEGSGVAGGQQPAGTPSPSNQTTSAGTGTPQLPTLTTDASGRQDEGEEIDPFTQALIDADKEPIDKPAPQAAADKTADEPVKKPAEPEKKVAEGEKVDADKADASAKADADKTGKKGDEEEETETDITKMEAGPLRTLAEKTIAENKDLTSVVSKLGGKDAVNSFAGLVEKASALDANVVEVIPPLVEGLKEILPSKVFNGIKTSIFWGSLDAVAKGMDPKLLELLVTDEAAINMYIAAAYPAEAGITKAKIDAAIEYAKKENEWEGFEGGKPATQRPEDTDPDYKAFLQEKAAKSVAQPQADERDKFDRQTTYVTKAKEAMAGAVSAVIKPLKWDPATAQTPEEKQIMEDNLLTLESCVDARFMAVPENVAIWNQAINLARTGDPHDAKKAENKLAELADRARVSAKPLIEIGKRNLALQREVLRLRGLKLKDADDSVHGAGGGRIEDTLQTKKVEGVDAYSEEFVNTFAAAMSTVAK